MAKSKGKSEKDKKITLVTEDALKKYSMHLDDLAAEKDNELRVRGFEERLERGEVELDLVLMSKSLDMYVALMSKVVAYGKEHITISSNKSASNNKFYLLNQNNIVFAYFYNEHGQNEIFMTSRERVCAYCYQCNGVLETLAANPEKYKLSGKSIILLSPITYHAASVGCDSGKRVYTKKLFEAGVKEILTL